MVEEKKENGYYLTNDSFRKLKRHVEYLDSKIRNTTPGGSPIIGGAITVIRFELTEELRRGQTKNARRIAFEGEDIEGEEEEIEVTEDNQLTSEMKAPVGTIGHATNTFSDGDDWLILSLDCEALVPHDGDLQPV